MGVVQTNGLVREHYCITVLDRLEHNRSRCSKIDVINLFGSLLGRSWASATYQPPLLPSPSFITGASKP